MSHRPLKMVWEGKRSSSRATANCIFILAALGMLFTSFPWQSNSGGTDIQSRPNVTGINGFSGIKISVVLEEHSYFMRNLLKKLH